MYHELRKPGTSAADLKFLHHLSLTRGRSKPAAAGSSPAEVPLEAEMRAWPVKRDLARGAVRRPSVGAGIAMQMIPVVVPLRDIAGREIGIVRLGECRRGNEQKRGRRQCIN